FQLPEGPAPPFAPPLSPLSELYASDGGPTGGSEVPGGAGPTARTGRSWARPVLGTRGGRGERSGRPGCGAHRRGDRDGDAEPDRDVADAEDVRQRQPRRQREDARERFEGRIGHDDAVRVGADPYAERRERRRARRHRAAVGDDRGKVQAGT